MSAQNQYLQFQEFGKPPKVLGLQTGPIPQPADDEVLIRLRFAAINPSHLLTVRGQYGQLPPDLPCIPGTEVSGVIEQVGASCQPAGDLSAELLKPGTRVTFIPTRMAFRGTWQQFITAKPDDLFVTPDFLSDQESGSIWINYLTAWVGLKEMHSFQSGQSMVITACDSQLSRALSSMVKILGGKTVGVTRRQSSSWSDYDHILSTADLDESDVKAVRQAVTAKLTALAGFENGCDHIFDSVGGAVGTALLNTLKDHGVYVVVGFLSGKPLHVFAPLIFNQATVRGFWITKWLENTDSDKIRSHVSELGQLLKDGRLAKDVGRSFPLAQFQDALAYLKENPRQGKVSFELNPA